jgi:hypothetical protein
MLKKALDLYAERKAREAKHEKERLRLQALN